MPILKEVKAYRMDPNADIGVAVKELCGIATKNPDASVELMVGRRAVVIDPRSAQNIIVDDIIEANRLNREEEMKLSRMGRGA